MALLLEERSVINKLLAKLTFPKIELKNIHIPELRKHRELTISEKFKILCPTWYSVITASSRGEADRIKERHDIRYSHGARCFMGEVYGFSDAYNTKNELSCGGCRNLAYNSGLNHLSFEFGFDKERIDNDVRIKALVDHIQEVHPKFLK